MFTRGSADQAIASMPSSLTKEQRANGAAAVADAVPLG